jgi:transcription initiation factor TFIID subunit TAF12
MGIKLGDISPLGGAITGKGMFGKGLAKLADSGMGMLIPASYLAQSQRDKRKRKAEEEEKKKGGTAAPAPTMRKGGKVKKMAKGGKLPDLTGDGKVTRADVLKGRGVPGFAKGGKVTRGDGCCMKGHTKGKMR